MWKKLNKEKCKDPEPQADQTSLVKSYKIQKAQEIDNNFLLSPAKDGRGNRQDKCKIGIDQVHRVIGDVPEGGHQNVSESKASKKLIKVLDKQLQAHQNQQYHPFKSDHHSEEIELQLHRVELTSDLKSRIMDFNNDAVSHNPQSSRDNNQSELEASSQRASEFKSFSLGVRQQKNILSLPQPKQLALKEPQKKWDQDEEPVIIYSASDINVDKNEPGKGMDLEQDKVIQNHDGMEVQDFFNQMREAGIDISDLQSNNNRSRDITMQFGDQSPTFKKGSSDQKEQSKEKQDQGSNSNKNMFHFSQMQKQQQEQEQMRNQPNIEQSNDLKKTKIKEGNKRREQHRDYYRIQPKEIEKMRQLKRILGKVLDQIKMVKIIQLEVHQVLEKFQVKKNEANRQIKSSAQGLVQMFAKLKQKIEEHEKMKLNKLDQNRVIEQLRYKVLELEAEILEKQVTISKQIEQIEDYKIKNQQLNESIFDKNQRIAQNQLILHKKVNEIIENYGAKQGQGKRQSLNRQYETEIQRLSQEVEQLTRLYSSSQQQHKIMIQKQKVAFTIEMEKIARKEAAWHQKQQLLEQRERKLEQDLLNYNIQREKIMNRQQQLEVMEKKFEQKIVQVEKIEIELNEGFAFLEQAKQQNEQLVEKFEAEKQELIAQVQTLKEKIFYLEQQNNLQRQKQPEYGRVKQASLISSLFDNDGKRKQGENKNGYPNQKGNRLMTEIHKRNENGSRFTTNYDNQQNGVESDDYVFASKSKFNHHFCQIDDTRRIKKGMSERDTQRFLENVKLANSKREYTQFSPGSKNSVKYLSQVASSSESLGSIPKILFVRDNSKKDTNIKSLKSRFQDNKRKDIFKKQNPKKSHRDLKLNQLDSKIEILRSEIKREINSAKQN